MTTQKNNWKSLLRELSRKESLIDIETKDKDSSDFISSRNKMPGTKAIQLVVITVLAVALILILKPQIVKLYGMIFSQKPVINTEVNDIHRMVIQNKTEELVKLLSAFRYKEDIDGYGWTPLHLAVLLNKKEIARILIDHGAKLSVKSTRSWHKYPKGVTPRDIALLNKNQELLEIL